MTCRSRSPRHRADAPHSAARASSAGRSRLPSAGAAAGGGGAAGGAAPRRGGGGRGGGGGGGAGAPAGGGGAGGCGGGGGTFFAHPAITITIAITMAVRDMLRNRMAAFSLNVCSCVKACGDELTGRSVQCQS